MCKRNGNITTINEKIQSFESAKSELVSSGLGQALSLTLANTWAQIVAALKGVANRGKLDWSGVNTTYSVPAGYYSGGTLDSRPSHNAGVTAGKSPVGIFFKYEEKNPKGTSNIPVKYVSSGATTVSG